MEKRPDNFYFEITYKIVLYDINKENKLPIKYNVPPFDQSNEFIFKKKHDANKFIECTVGGIEGKFTVGVLSKNIQRGILINTGKINENIGYKTIICTITKKLYTSRLY